MNWRARGMTTTELSAVPGIDAASVGAVLSGTSSITGGIAWTLESVLDGISARFWMGLRADSDLGVERLKRKTA